MQPMIPVRISTLLRNADTGLSSKFVVIHPRIRVLLRPEEKQWLSRETMNGVKNLAILKDGKLNLSSHLSKDCLARTYLPEN